MSTPYAYAFQLVSFADSTGVECSGSVQTDEKVLWRGVIKTEACPEDDSRMLWSMDVDVETESGNGYSDLIARDQLFVRLLDITDSPSEQTLHQLWFFNIGGRVPYAAYDLSWYRGGAFTGYPQQLSGPRWSPSPPTGDRLLEVRAYWQNANYITGPWSTWTIYGVNVAIART